MKFESKIIGFNPLCISVLLIGTFLIVCATGGDNVNWGYLGFEVIFPFYMAIAIGEWCKTRTDPMFEVISAQGKSMLCWIIRRFVLLFMVISVFIFIGMLGISTIKQNISVLDLIVAFVPTAFFLSSVCLFISLLGNTPHVPAMAVGIIWLFSIMTMSLLRFVPMQYVYLFVRYAGVKTSIGIVNKVVLLFMSAILWIGIFSFCKRRIWCK